MEIGPIKGIVLIGGGEVLLELACWAKKNSINVLVIISPRHANEQLPSGGGTLRLGLQSNHLNFIEVVSIDSDAVATFLADTQDWLFLSLSAAWIFKKKTIEELFGDKLLNAHGTRLPTNRGGGGFSWQIMMGNRFGFSLIHKVDSGVDTGPIVDFEEYLFPNSCRIPRDFEQIHRSKTISFLEQFISKVIKGKVIFDEIKQIEYLSTYWPRLNTDINGWINWDWPAIEIEKFICAFDEPYSGAQTLLNGKRVSLKGVVLSPQDALFHPYQTGIVYRVTKNWICIALSGNTLVVEGVMDQNGNSVLGKIRNGDRFITPSKYLEDSLSRGIYTPQGFRTRN